MDLTTYMVKLLKQQEEQEVKARDDMLNDYKEHQKENILLRLQVNSLNEIIGFKETNIQILQTKVEDKDKEIADLKEAKRNLNLIVRGNSVENQSTERTECLQSLLKFFDEFVIALGRFL